MGGIRGVLLDESLLFANNVDGNTYFLPGAETLLRRFQYFKLHMGISYMAGASSQKEIFLKRIATLYSFDCIMMNASCMDDALDKTLLAWSGSGEGCYYVTPNEHKDLFFKLGNQGWRIVIISSKDDAKEDTKFLFIDKLEELPLTLCRSSKMAVHDTSVVTVGYVMKPSREEDFAKRGAFPIYPTQNGLMFVPLTFNLPLESQMQEIDVILHKATDEIISIDLNSLIDFSKGVSFSKGMQDLQRYVQDHPDCCVIDPLNNIYPLLDRLSIQQILCELEDLNRESHCRIRSPYFLKVDHFNEPDLEKRFSKAKLSFPSIVKPQVACGVADAHNMAIVFKIEDFRDLGIPLPAIVQEYIDHGSMIFKFYVLGEKVFHAVKKSIPNADVLISSSEKNGFSPIIFDSLKSLPTAEKDLSSGSGFCSKVNEQSLDLALVTDAANWLRRRLDLTIFGFDVVIQESSGDHVIVDVNYLPSFKEVPDDMAMPAFWNAIKSSYESRKEKQAAAPSH